MEVTSVLFTEGKDVHLLFFSFFSRRRIIFWIELPQPENLGNTCAWRTETLDSCFDLIKSHQQRIRWSWGYNNYADAYFQSPWEDVALEMTVSSVKSTDVTCKTHSGWLAAQLPWLVDLASPVCDVGLWSVVEFWLCILWSLVRSPVGEFTVYAADET